MSTERPAALFAGVEPLEVFVELLADLPTETSSTDFYDRICEAICRLTTMSRAAIFLADLPRRRAVVVGAHGTSFRPLITLSPSPELLASPIAQRALVEDQVVIVEDGIEQQVPRVYAELFGITTLVCAPISAGGQAYGVICADRGGGHFELSDGERHLLWTLGKTTALVATARNMTRSQERSRRLTEQLELAREIHERVVQRLFGVSLTLSADAAVEGEQRERCLSELQEATAELRSALERPLAPPAPESQTTLADEVARLSAPELPAANVTVDWPDGVAVPADVEPLAQSVLAEALRNVDKHASATNVHVTISCEADTFTLEVHNDGVQEGVRGAGMGLRLAAFEALQHGGVVEFGPAEPGCWRVRLVLPLATDEVTEAVG
ncbi:MAG TPA: GAF domain-containing protein [Solirubrobacteraceae bacterium]|nr:GAF domain-containing protein [Solirubrobacteraceae bacterium]